MYALIIVFGVLSSGSSTGTATPIGVTSQIVGKFKDLDECKAAGSSAPRHRRCCGYHCRNHFGIALVLRIRRCELTQTAALGKRTESRAWSRSGGPCAPRLEQAERGHRGGRTEPDGRTGATQPGAITGRATSESSHLNPTTPATRRSRERRRG